MAANIDPIFALVPLVAKCNVVTANTARDGSGTIATLVTATTDGTKVAKIWYKAEVTTTAGMVRLFISDVNGENPDMFDEMPVAAVTVAANTKSAEGYILYSDLNLRAGQVISASTHNAESINVFAEIGDF